MRNFTYYAPTKIVFGKQTEQQAGALVRQQGGSRVLLVLGSGSARRSGLLARVEESLAQAGLAWVILDGVTANPRLTQVEQGIALARDFGADFLLAVGGGSVIDAAKAIGYGLAYNGPVWDLFCGKAQPQACLPLGAVLTIAAAGSEMSNSCVLTNDQGALKRACNSDLSRLRFAILNPELTYTLPPYQTACGVADILMHTMERYFHNEPDTALTDSLAEGLLRTVLDCGRVLLRQPDDYAARAELMWAGSLSHNGLMGCGSQGDWACHQLGHELSGAFDCAHGASLTAVWPAWASYVLPGHTERLARFATQVLAVPPDGDAAETARRGVAALTDYFRWLALPTNLRELGLELDDAALDTLSRKCTFFRTRTIGRFQVLDYADVRAIYGLARG